MKKLLSKSSYGFILIQLLLTLLFSITLIFLILILLHPENILSQSTDDIILEHNELFKPVILPDSQPERMYGITIDGVNKLNNISASISRHNKRMTTRIVFDEWQPASSYTAAVNRLDTISDIMGEILDSYYVKDYTVDQYTNRAGEYVNAFGEQVDIWEVGNEINGEWLGDKDSVVLKLVKAFLVVRKAGKKTALTLYYNRNCWENPQNEMFRWVNANIPGKLKQSLDYVFVSYYEDDCNGYQPNWQQVFDSLHVIFPNSMLGIGECGTSNANRKAEYITRYYSMNVTTPSFIGGFFWWYYRQDCVLWSTKPLWLVLDNAIMNSGDRGNMIKDGDGY